MAFETRRPIIGVDIGGTFTDCAIIDSDGRVYTGKVPTRPEDRAGSFFGAIEEAAGRCGRKLDEMLVECGRLVHGTTTGTNALITREGASVGLVTTAGFRDVPEFMNGAGRLVGLAPVELLDPWASYKPETLVPRRLIQEVNERVDFEGEVIVPLDESTVREAAAGFRDSGVEAVAVSLLWSVRNDEHEQRVLEILKEELPDVFVTTASGLSTRVGELERTMSSVINGYIGPLMRRYIDGIECGARDSGYEGRVLYAQCAGGAITADEAREAPIRTLHSGPVSGTLGAAYLADRIGHRNLIVTDMGGTSFDVSIVHDSKPDIREVSTLERFEVALPMVHIDTVGAGGGSIAWVDEAGGLQVGPRSATAYPGPACYGRGGTEPTVTDADVVLGVIDPDNFLHGAMRLDRAKAEEAVAGIAERLGLGVLETAAGISRIVDANMADLVRRMSVMRGLDPREFVMFAYGGMGPVHAAAVARDVGVDRVVVPLVHAAPVWSAFGAAIAQVTHVHQRWENVDAPLSADRVVEAFAELDRSARGQLLEEGFAADRVELRRSVRMKYLAQAFDLEVPVEGEELSKGEVGKIEQRFHRLYAELHGEGAGYREGGAQITAFIVRSSGAENAPELAPSTRGDGTASERPVYWEEFGEVRQTRILHTGGAIDGVLRGPLLIELPDTVVVVRPGQRADFDQLGDLTIEL